jgi:predicted nucleic acid-binding protein
MKMVDWLGQHQKIYVDTAIFIYQIEDVMPFSTQLEPLVDALESGRITWLTSTITLTEVLVKPLQNADTYLIDVYNSILTKHRHIQMMPVIPEIARRAAYVRQQHRIKTPDALHLATAWHHACDSILTNDNQLKQFTGVPVVLLQDLV